MEISIISISGIMIWIAVSAILFGALQLLSGFNPRTGLLIAITLGFLASFISTSFGPSFLRFSEIMIFILVFFFFVVLITKFIGVENLAKAIGGNSERNMLVPVLVVLVPAVIILVVIGASVLDDERSQTDDTTLQESNEVATENINGKSIDSSQQKRIGETPSSSSIFGSAIIGVLLLFIIGALMIAFFNN